MKVSKRDAAIIKSNAAQSADAPISLILWDVVLTVGKDEKKITAHVAAPDTAHAQQMACRNYEEARVERIERLGYVHVPANPAQLIYASVKSDAVPMRDCIPCGHAILWNSGHRP